MNLERLKIIYKELGVDHKESLRESTGVTTITISSIYFLFRTEYFFNKEGGFIEQRDSVMKDGRYCLN